MESLIVERQGGVVTVTMNRPERKNAANAVMLLELPAIFEEIEANAADRVMVLTGAGGAFCSGADLGDPNGPASDTSRSPLATSTLSRTRNPATKKTASDSTARRYLPA